jgi:cell division GTPase FtsZ
MHILLLSAGGGGGNILRSLKAAFRRDLAVAQQADPKYAERLRRAVATRFLDTNEFALSDVPKDERLLIGAQTTGRLGARHDPDVARQALKESHAEVEALIERYSIVILVGTGGKGTGAGTMFPLAQIAREQKKLVIPIFVRPSFECHEVDKRHYDHAVRVIEQFDAARIRLVEILNDRGYVESDPQSQATVWERMNLPIARGLRGLIHVLWDLSQVDPSDLSVLFAGHGRLRMGFAEIDPPAGGEPGDEMVEQAARRCCENPFYAFDKPPGTSLVCIQGDWSNVVDAKIKRRMATAMGLDSRSPYSPLYARAAGTPKPWGVTALFAEYTGKHPPLDLDWTLERGVRASAQYRRLESEALAARPPVPSEAQFAGPAERSPEDMNLESPREGSFPTFWEFAVAVNRAEPAALALAANGAPPEIPIDGAEVRRLFTAMWFRTVLSRLSADWRDRLLNALVEHVRVTNHPVRHGRQVTRLRELTYAQLQEIASTTSLADGVRPDMDLLITVGRLWGADAVKRIRFSEISGPHQPSKLHLLDRFLG